MPVQEPTLPGSLLLSANPSRDEVKEEASKLLSSKSPHALPETCIAARLPVLVDAANMKSF
jgi:hypothetical protein